MDEHTIAVQAAAKKLVCRPPQIQAKTPVVELTEAVDDKFTVGIEVARPLLKGEKIAVPVVEDFEGAQGCPGQLVEKVMQNEKRVVPRVNVLYHEGRQLVLPGASASVKKDISARLQQRCKFG